MSSADVDVADAAEKNDRDIPPLQMPKKQELCTVQLRRFLKRHFKVFDFFFFGLHLASKSDEARARAVKALASVDPERYAADLKAIEEEPSPTQKKLNEFGDLQGENIVIRTVDNFLSYLSEIIQQAIIKRPEILRSEETIKVEDVLRFSRYSDLIAYLVERKVNDLSYSNIKDVERFVRKRTGLQMFENDEERTLLILAIEIRNIYTHNRRVVSETTLRKLHGLKYDWKLEKGKHFGTGYDEIVVLSNNLILVARRLDESFSKKFGIRRKRYGSYDKSTKRR
jgi:hypothetical protein